MTTTDDLLDDIFDRARPALYHEFAGWVRDSRRFRAFAAAYRVKIRAKLKRVRTEYAMLDLRAELETAALLLADESFTVEYEKYAAARRRGPDFAVTYKTHTLFNVEVRRIAGVELDADEGATAAKLMSVLLDKVGQMPPGTVNLLWLSAERAIPAAGLENAAVSLRQLAERKDDPFFTHRGFESAAAFLKQYRHLSGVILHRPRENVLWLNSLAQHRASRDLVNAIRRLPVATAPS